MNLRKLAVTALMLGIAGTLATIGPAQAATSSIAENMKTWDPDKDGTLDPTEVNKAAGAKFDGLDPDKDGTLTKDEYLTIVELRFKAADPDNDGTVSVAELQTKAGKALVLLIK